MDSLENEAITQSEIEKPMELNEVAIDANSAELTETSSNTDNGDESITTATTNLKSIDIPQGDAKWYILHTFSGYEATAKQNLENVVENGNLYHRIQNIVVPEQEIIEEQNGKRKIKKIRTMPSYLFIKMVYGDDLWHTITRTRGVTGFVGPKGRPLPMTDDEIRRLHLEKIAVDFELSIGEVVEIIDGPLQGNPATIVSVDAENKKCKANVSLFGRETLTDIAYDQIRKLN